MNKLFRTMLVTIIASACALAGDLTITFNSKTKGPMGSGQGVETQYYNVNFHKTVNESTKIDSLVDYGKGIFYTIKHKEKTVEMMTFDDLVAIMKANEARMANLPKNLQAMMGGGQTGDVKVDKIGDETVAGRACKKYKLSLGKLTEELSMDPSLTLPVNASAFAKFASLKTGMMGPAGGGMKKLTEEMVKLQGVALKTHMTGMMGMEISTEATAVSTTAISATVFTLPAGYKLVDEGKKMLADLQKS